MHVGASTSLISGGVISAAIQASCSNARGTVPLLMNLREVSASRTFLPRPREMAKPLASMASLPLNLVRFNAPYVFLPEKQAVIDYPFRCFLSIAPDPEGAMLAQWFVPRFFCLSHVISSIRHPLADRSLSSIILEIPCCFSSSGLNSSVGVRCTTIPNLGFTSLVSLPSSVLLWAGCL
ncbi:hypothetical protein I7I50_06872 [Histoplasma capsulatum G186AR]|uniref:Uncharacterized protein n=1 Tax=Ajellomyces capsulatus TaxID=5037 RepID=A0A8H7Z0A1_AJECA|nr:hypothetical protein I7I52_10054 [Histoplasma capsulatum]QSS67711.1 hypothetical protein I7I50_06872 [Histoplasma capsulatum G186AR]